MLSAWTHHLQNDPEAKQKFEDYVRGSTLLINRLNDMIISLERELERSERSPEVFKDPNWAYTQAWKNGYKSAIEKLKVLIAIDPKRTNEQPVGRPTKSAE